MPVWVRYDVRRLLDAVQSGGKLPSEVAVIGQTTAGLVALCAAATDDRVTHAATIGSLASYVSDVPYQGQRLGLLVPGILREIGDVPHIAALTSPQTLVIAGGVWGSGQALSRDELDSAYQPLSSLWHGAGVKSSLRVIAETDAAAVAEELVPVLKRD